jgi:hypothetical protein
LAPCEKEATVSGPPSMSVSFASTSTSTKLSSLVAAVSLAASGASFTAFTVTLTVPVASFGSAAPLLVPLSRIV